MQINVEEVKQKVEYNLFIKRTQFFVFYRFTLVSIISSILDLVCDDLKAGNMYVLQGKY